MWSSFQPVNNGQFINAFENHSTMLGPVVYSDQNSYVQPVENFQQVLPQLQNFRFEPQHLEMMVPIQQPPVQYVQHPMVQVQQPQLNSPPPNSPPLLRSPKPKERQSPERRVERAEAPPSPPSPLPSPPLQPERVCCSY